jgi:hypothetical protein
MDEEFEQLEAELRRLRPIAPGEGLRGAIARELAPAPSANFFRRARTWIALPVAAAIVGSLLYFTAFTGLNSSKPVTPVSASSRVAVQPSAPQFKPVAARNILVSATDEGLVSLADGTPARRIRQSYVDTITWQNAATKASLTWTVPREEVKVVPVSYQ